MLLKYLIVGGIAAIPWGEEWLAIPIGIIIGLPPISVMIIAFLGNLFPVFIILLIYRLRNNDTQLIYSSKAKRAAYYFEKYGLPGLALLAPIFTGVYISTITALIIGIPPRKIILWMSCGLGIWAIIMTIISVSGIQLFL